jgi:hypothetical protein
LLGGLEHNKIKTRFIDERFASVMGECENVSTRFGHVQIYKRGRVLPLPGFHLLL